MKRIVKETFKNGKEQYRIETNRILYFIPWKWHTYYIKKYSIWAATDIKYPAIFGTLDEAKKICGVDVNPIKREIVWK